MIGKLLQAVYNEGQNSIIIPRVTARQLNLEDLDIGNLEGLKHYLAQVEKSVLDTYYKFTAHPEESVKSDFPLQLIELEKRILKTIRFYQRQDKKYPRFLIIARVRDFCVSYFARIFTTNEQISGRRLETLISRLSKMEIMGYSDYIAKEGRIVFLCSELIPFLSKDGHLHHAKKLHLNLNNVGLSYKNSTEYLVFHQPEYKKIKFRFEQSLEDNFLKLYHTQNQQFISIPDVRENVCLDLKISARTFDKFMKEAYYDSFNRQSDLDITLSNDRSYVTYTIEQWHRKPLMLENDTMTVVRIRRQTA